MHSSWIKNILAVKLIRWLSCYRHRNYLFHGGLKNLPRNFFYTFREGFARKNIGRITAQNYTFFRIPKNQSIANAPSRCLYFKLFHQRSFQLELFAGEGRTKLVNSFIVDYFRKYNKIRNHKIENIKDEMKNVTSLDLRIWHMNCCQVYARLIS